MGTVAAFGIPNKGGGGVGGLPSSSPRAPSSKRQSAGISGAPLLAAAGGLAAASAVAGTECSYTCGSFVFGFVRFAFVLSWGWGRGYILQCNYACMEEGMLYSGVIFCVFHVSFVYVGVHASSLVCAVYAGLGLSLLETRRAGECPKSLATEAVLYSS